LTRQLVLMEIKQNEAKKMAIAGVILTSVRGGISPNSRRARTQRNAAPPPVLPLTTTRSTQSMTLHPARRPSRGGDRGGAPSRAYLPLSYCSARDTSGGRAARTRLPQLGTWPPVIWFILKNKNHISEFRRNLKKIFA
jgi:hypothetical protein